MKRVKIKCLVCGREISKSNYDRHFQCHFSNHDSKTIKYHLDHDDLFCKFCGKPCKNRNSMAQHEIRCGNNPNRITVNLDYNRSPWNFGLTKDTDDRVKKNSEALKRTVMTKVASGWLPACATEEYWTEDRKKKQSEKRKKIFVGESGETSK